MINTKKNKNKKIYKVFYKNVILLEKIKIFKNIVKNMTSKKIKYHY